MKNSIADHRSKRNRHHDNEMPPPPPVPNTTSIVSGPLMSVEGWVTFVTGIHEEAQEEDIREVFCDFGKIKSIVLNADRKSGLAKGYALVEFLERNEAQDAINALHGKPLLGQKIGVHWAFCKSNASR
jgi:RNA-binding protein 8A